MALVEWVTYGLADKMRRHGVAREAMAVEELALTGEIVGLAKRTVDLEVIAPAREFQPVESPVGGPLSQVREREIGPLAREQCDRTTHTRPPGSALLRIADTRLPRLARSERRRLHDHSHWRPSTRPGHDRAD